jgi:hypothetical protein
VHHWAFCLTRRKQSQVLFLSTLRGGRNVPSVEVSENFILDPSGGSALCAGPGIAQNDQLTRPARPVNKSSRRNIGIPR